VPSHNENAPPVQNRPAGGAGAAASQSVEIAQSTQAGKSRKLAVAGSIAPSKLPASNL